MFKRFVLAALMALGVMGSAHAALTISPADIQAGDCTGPGTGNDPAFIAGFCTAMLGLTEQYKQDVGGGESGALAAHYTATFNGDASGGTISWDGPLAVECSASSACWLLVKDGNQQPGRYAFDLTTRWDGVMTITLEDFWPQQGAISHVAIYSGNTRTPPSGIPAPAVLGLLGVALLGFRLKARRA